jgi:Flp pilus assembly protein TadG
MTPRWMRNQRGSATIELAVLAPAILAVFAATIVAGRVNLARLAIEAAAFDAARTASLARTAAMAQTQAQAAANSALDAQGLHCTSVTVTVTTVGFAVPVGRPATVTARVECQASFTDVALPGFPGGARLSASFTSPLDQYRTRG